MILLNPRKLSRQYSDERSLEVMASTVDFFEKKGKKRLKEDAHQRVWYGTELLNARHVFPGSRINPNRLPLLQEQRHFHHGTG